MSVSIEENKPNGPAAAAFIAAGAACFALGLIISLNEASVIGNSTLDFAKNYGIGSGVGPLSGKVILSTIVFVVVWAILGVYWRFRDVNFTRAFTVACVLLALGFLLTFPPVFDKFAGK